MSSKILLQSIILRKKSAFTFSDIVSDANAERIVVKDLNKEIKSVISTYIRNGMICITERGYERCSF